MIPPAPVNPPVLLPTYLQRRPWLAIALLGLLMALAFQGSRGLWDPDEGRYANVALQMLDRDEFVTLYRHHESFHFTKPPLSYWGIAASVAALGWNEWAVRLPNALAFLLGILLVYRMGRVFVPGRPWLPALVYATAPFPFFAANWVSTDVVLALATSATMTCYVAARFEAASARAWVGAMWCAAGLAFLAKGPPGLLPLAVILAHRYWRGGPGLWNPWGALGFAVLGLGWYLAVVVRHPGLLDYFLGHEVVARLTSERLDRSPQWYGPLLVYLPVLTLGLAPWVFGLFARGRWRPPPLRLGDDRQALLWLWLLLPLLVFSLSRSRMPLYVLPLVAPISLLLGRALSDMDWPRWRQALLGGWIALLLFGKAALAQYGHGNDAREYARQLRPLLPEGGVSEIVFYDDMARYGLHLYLRAEIAKSGPAPFEPRISEASFDDTLAEDLAEAPSRRVFVFKREMEPRFLAAVREAGLGAIDRGTVEDDEGRRQRDRRVYVLAEDFPQLAPR
jgi:4-amino-4-deoxy-L-arabinose transferase-like glycosyltransferase